MVVPAVGCGVSAPPYRPPTKSLKRLLAETRIAKLPHCGKEGHLAIGYNPESSEYVGVYRPHSCGSVFCPYCARRKRLQVLHPYKEALKNLPPKVPVVFATLTVPNGFDAKERIEFAFKALTKLYDLRPFGKRKFAEVKEAFYAELKEYARNLKAKGYSPKVIRKKVRLQKSLFKKFVNRYRNLPNVERLKLGQLIPALWVFELTKSAEGYHPHWHGIVLTQIPKVLLTALWKMATKGEAYITDIRKVSNTTEAMEYVEDYVADGFVDIGGNADTEEMIAIEEALHGRRKVRAWGFDLIRGQQFGQKAYGSEGESPYLWVHSYGLKMELLRESRKENLHDYWSVRRKARKEGKKVPYVVLRVRFAKELFGKELFLLGHMRPDGLIELEPISEGDKELWEGILVGLFDYNGSIKELIRGNSIPDVGLIL